MSRAPSVNRGVGQVALFEPRPPTHWYVEVNEVRLFTYGWSSEARNHWVVRRPMWEMFGRLTVVQAGFPGDLVRVGPLSRGDAGFFLDFMLGKGAPAAAMKIVRERGR